ncbi:MAG TPA: hypothetical protein VNT03_16955 [Baekduia sp.]|nr:hypothetical protein [Baekduia sp.]
MPTRTNPQPSSRTGRRPTPASQGRFGRTTPASQGRFGRAGGPSRPGRPRLPGRRKPQQSTAKKALSTITGALPRSSSSKKGGGKRRAGGMALLAGGLGLAMKNRDKLQGMMGRHDDQGTATSPPPTPSTTPSPGTYSPPQAQP